MRRNNLSSSDSSEKIPSPSFSWSSLSAKLQRQLNLSQRLRAFLPEIKEAPDFHLSSPNQDHMYEEFMAVSQLRLENLPSWCATQGSSYKEISTQGQP